jgi:hypothetical protein
MRIILPHLPNNFDTQCYYYISDFIVFPKHLIPFDVKTITMEQIRAKKNKKAIDLTSLHGVIRTG